ncbi:transporter [Vibrio metschnikovii]|uniref:transporter n=1 Tax=Vibrio metschnikovii TaxID=28172 RepID=UPI001C30565F|nr:transporter [Vibrio metschnikovii]
MQQSQRVSVVFDYASFLGASCTKRWNFSDVLASFAPIFGTVWQDTVKQSKTHEERLWDLALSTLSSRRSDEANLIALLKLAKAEGIEELTLIMPYGLEPAQVLLIEQSAEVKLQPAQGDEFLVVVNPALPVS